MENNSLGDFLYISNRIWMSTPSKRLRVRALNPSAETRSYLSHYGIRTSTPTEFLTQKCNDTSRRHMVLRAFSYSAACPHDSGTKLLQAVQRLLQPLLDELVKGFCCSFPRSDDERNKR